MQHVPNSAPSEVLSFVRQNDQDKVFAVFNFSDQTQKVEFTESLHLGEYNDYLAEEKYVFDEATQLQLSPWGFKVFVRP